MATLEKATLKEDSYLSNTPVANRSSDASAKVEGAKKDAKEEEQVDPNHEEYQYLNLIKEILRDGEHRPDRYSYPVYSNRILSFQAHATLCVPIP